MVRRSLRRGRVAGVFVALAALAVACSGSDSVTADSSVRDENSVIFDSAAWDIDAESFSPEVVAVVDALIGDHGDGALAVLLYALERGYTYKQIARGAADGVIGADGFFVDDTSPNGTAAGVLSLPDGDGEGASGLRIEGTDRVLEPARFRAQGLDDEKLSVDFLRETYSSVGVEPDRALALMIAALARDGYSLEQITDAIVLGTGIPTPTNDFARNPDGTRDTQSEETHRPHVCLFTRDGALIQPEVPIGANAICADTTIGREPPTTADDDGPERVAQEPIDQEPDGPAEDDVTDAGPGQLTWSGEVPVTGYEDRRLYEDPALIITINRIEGTDDYRGEFLLEIAGPYGEACSQVNTYHFIGQGTASASSPPAQIVMTGRQTESYVRGDCTAEWADLAVERTDESEETILLSSTNEGISGSWFSGVVTEFLLPSD